MKNLNKLYKECLFDVHSLGINTGKINSISINTWYRCGRCNGKLKVADYVI